MLMLMMMHESSRMVVMSRVRHHRLRLRLIQLVATMRRRRHVDEIRWKHQEGNLLIVVVLVSSWLFIVMFLLGLIVVI